ncbi:hypothetical protein OH76DRAFT_1405623 [Lentinus brumalis]|uniref:Uncharacterized protein n=1 Tax=Lentinus brumalis TaxID=2498619 RepID=A0A371D512_9APHY|nr:hypothetical protein OH76DRAFT_1405623 [Polyporus brumalis]
MACRLSNFFTQVAFFQQAVGCLTTALRPHGGPNIADRESSRWWCSTFLRLYLASDSWNMLTTEKHHRAAPSLVLTTSLQ